MKLFIGSLWRKYYFENIIPIQSNRTGDYLKSKIYTFKSHKEIVELIEKIENRPTKCASLIFGPLLIQPKLKRKSANCQPVK